MSLDTERFIQPPNSNSIRSLNLQSTLNLNQTNLQPYQLSSSAISTFKNNTQVGLSSLPQIGRTDAVGLLDATLDKSLLDQRILRGTLESQIDPTLTLNGISNDLNVKIQEQLAPKLSGENLELSYTKPKSPKDLSKASNAMGIVGQVADLANSFIPEKSEYSGDKGTLAQGLDTAYDSIANAAMAIPGAGTIIGGAMKLGALAGDGLNALGVGTSGMTTIDAILGSSFLNLTPIGLINSLGASETSTLTKDQEAFNIVGSSYTGTNYNVDEALTKSGKKYGLFSQKAKGQANSQIYEAQRQQNIMKDIAQDTENRLALQESMSGINSNNRKYNLQGGYNYTNARVGKNGMSIELLKRAKSITQKYQEGGNLKDPFQYYLSTLPKNQRDSAGFRVKDYWEFYGKPKDFAEAVDKGMFIYNNSDSSWHASSIALNPTTGELEYMKASTHPTRHMESDWYEQGIIYNDDGTKSVLTEGTPGYNEWKDFIKEWKLVKSEPYWKYVRRTPKNVESHKNGGSVNQVIPTNIILIDPMTIPEFQGGGQINKKSRTLQELIQYAKEVNPRFIQRMSEPLKYVDWDDSEGHHFGTHELGYTEMDGKYFVYPSIQEDKDGNLIRYTPEDWRQAVDNAYRNKNGLFFNTEEEAKIFTESQENPDGTFSGYKSGWPEFFKQRPTKYQDGGSINVIPDGALHARKHNMEMDGITQRGIPVVSETEDGKVEQQAEIEKEEIIFRLEVTKKLEELQKVYYSEESSQKEKDDASLEAGKLLVNEILYNTVDRTNNLI